ncbi:MAG: glycosyltransferase [Thermomicrobiales bacterium]
MSDWWQSDFQTTIDAYYQGDVAAGMAAAERLLSADGLPGHVDVQARRNQVFYARPLDELAPSTRKRPIEFPVPEGWSRFNPSIAADPESDGFKLNVRSSNYVVTPRLHYTAHDPQGVIRTVNYLADIDCDLTVQDVRLIDDSRFRPEPPPFPVSGFEDNRLVYHRGAWWTSATVRDRSVSGICQIALSRIEDATVTDVHLLSDASTRHEKNWMPVVHGSSEPLRFIYSSSPVVILRYDDETGKAEPDLIQPGLPIARSFSGGTQVIPLNDGHLCLIHDRANFDDGGRVYTHRWVWFDANWQISLISYPFLLQERGIEFAGGLAQMGDDLVISYGVWDREAWLATVPLAEVLPLLAPPLDVAADAAPEPATAADDAGEEPVWELVTEEVAAPVEFTRYIGSPSIVAMTMTGSNREIIGEALASVVDWVDWCLVIDTGITDDTLDIAREIAGDKLVVKRMPWQEDFAAARNFALATAAALGADWAVTLDTDERIEAGEIDIRAALAETSADSLHVKFSSGTYGKERFFRLPAHGRFVGPTHEAFIREGGNGSETLEGVTFDELGKTHEQYRRKAERDIAILTRHTAAHPDDPRWFYYLGDSLAGLGRFEEAIAAFRTCASLRGWDEEGGWAMFRAAECLMKLDRPEDAVEACATGLARHAGLGELSWLAAYASWHAGRAAQAVYWARHAVALGQFAGVGDSVPRIGFRHPPGLWEGPYDVLRFALREVGDDAGAEEAERLFQDAMTKRLSPDVI